MLLSKENTSVIMTPMMYVSELIYVYLVIVYIIQIDIDK